jgi:hypothetical protein
MATELEKAVMAFLVYRPTGQNSPMPPNWFRDEFARPVLSVRKKPRADE